MRISFALLAIGVLCAPVFHSLHAQPQHANDDFEHIIDSIMEDHDGSNKPGATIGIIRAGALVFQKGYGMADMRSGVHNDPAVLYNIASGSKQFTAYLIALLINEQRLMLTDDIRKYIPEFPDYGHRITIENLLYHTSGIRDYMVLMWLTGKSFESHFTNKEAIRLIVRQQNLFFTPGERCVYSNSNYVLLAEIIHRVTGETLAEYARQRLFAQMEMKCSAFGNSRKATTSYGRQEDDYIAYKNNFAVNGDGGMITTLSDLLQWDRVFYTDSEQIKQLLLPGTLSNGAPLMYGSGILLGTYRDKKIQTHPGGFLGFRSELLRFPDEHLTIICLANSGAINPESITRAIADRIVFGDTEVSSKDRHPNCISALQALAFTGEYEVTKKVWITIRYENGLLTGQASGQPVQLLYPEEGNSFRIGSTSDKVVFGIPENGLFQKLTIVQQHGSTPAHRLAEVAPADQVSFTGTYYCEEQGVTYAFVRKKESLWLKTGNSAEVKVAILKKYNRVCISYQNMERASIDFAMSEAGTISGFALNSARTGQLQFIKK